MLCYLMLCYLHSERRGEGAHGQRGDGGVRGERRGPVERHHGPVQNLPDVRASAAQPHQAGQPAAVPDPPPSAGHAHREV